MLDNMTSLAVILLETSADLFLKKKYSVQKPIGSAVPFPDTTRKVMNGTRHTDHC